MVPASLTSLYLRMSQSRLTDLEDLRLTLIGVHLVLVCLSHLPFKVNVPLHVQIVEQHISHHNEHLNHDQLIVHHITHICVWSLGSSSSGKPFLQNRVPFWNVPCTRSSLLLGRPHEGLISLSTTGSRPLDMATLRLLWRRMLKPPLLCEQGTGVIKGVCFSRHGCRFTCNEKMESKERGEKHK
ncbi:hypothetical protein BCR34DRAFT_555182 [Clohesyomyces aquaticus]|uniref:Uncharacterized protein n=1 Tax=Clohesyomyces aquaticus TaxID=1231657 RepID=A0A1Y2A534_9PLEO|nr:hypothetical protein BCR34DRAFT_555182 [Clohesyomyces aquaticus]